MAEINIEDNLEKINVWVDNVRKIAYQLQENVNNLNSVPTPSETTDSTSADITQLNNDIKERKDTLKKLENFEREIQKKVLTLIQSANTPELIINNNLQRINGGRRKRKNASR